jgi:iron-sulfur cluster repair protein YtfE (RIC family)
VRFIKTITSEFFHQIKKEKLKTDLITLMEKAEKITKEKKVKKNELKQKFDNFKEDIKNNRKKDMTEQAYQILLYDLQFLKDIYFD